MPWESVFCNLSIWIATNARTGPPCVKQCRYSLRKCALLLVNPNCCQSRFSLQRLLLSSNGIAQIPCPAEGQSEILQGLRHLALPSNLLCSWNDIDALSRWCPGLKTLALGLNPFVVGLPATSLNYGSRRFLTTICE